MTHKEMAEGIAELIEKTVQHAVAAEREACYQIAAGFILPGHDVGRIDGRGDDAEAIAQAIRARGQQ